MRIQIRGGYDGRIYQINSSNQETIAAWLLETLNRIRPDYACPAQIDIWPEFDAEGKPDWITDGAVLGYTEPVKSPQELVNFLQQQIDRAEKRRAG